MVKENKSYQVNEARLLFTELGGEGVIYDLEKNDYFSLNETYCCIFLKIRKGTPVFNIISELMKEYEVAQETCEKEVEEVIVELKERKFIHETHA